MFCNVYLSRRGGGVGETTFFFPLHHDIMSPLREGIEDKLGSEDFSLTAGCGDWEMKC